MSTALWPLLWLWASPRCEELDVEGTEWERLDKGHLLDLWCQITHPHHPFVFSSEYQNVSRWLFFFFPCRRLKNGVVFLGSAGIADCNSFSAKHYGWTDIIWGAGWRSKLCFSYRVNRGHEENQGYQATGVKQERAKWDQWYEQRCQPLLHLHLPPVLLCEIWLYFIGASGKEWRTWTCGNYSLKIDIEFVYVYKHVSL